MTTSSPGSPRRVLAVVPDLYFASRIGAVAAAAKVEVEFVPPARAADRCREAPPALVLLDLHAEASPQAIVRALKAASAAPVIGFYSHVDAERRRLALEAGLDEALPRSAFVTRLAAILAGAGAAR